MQSIHEKNNRYTKHVPAFVRQSRIVFAVFWIEPSFRCRCNRKMNIIAAYLICNGRLCIHNDLFVVSFPYCGAGIRSEMYCLFGTRLCCGKRKSNSYVRTVATSTFWMSCLWRILSTLFSYFAYGKPSTSFCSRKSRLFTSNRI